MEFGEQFVTMSLVRKKVQLSVECLAYPAVLRFIKKQLLVKERDLSGSRLWSAGAMRPACSAVQQLLGNLITIVNTWRMWGLNAFSASLWNMMLKVMKMMKIEKAELQKFVELQNLSSSQACQ